MPKIQYTGLSHIREISNADFKSVGVEDQNKCKWVRDERTVLDVSEAAATYLLEQEPKGEFTLIEDEPEVLGEVAPQSDENATLQEGNIPPAPPGATGPAGPTPTPGSSTP